MSVEHVILENTLHQYFPSDEIKQFNYFHKKKRTEKILGRLAAKTLIEFASGAHPKSILIKNHPSGAPYVDTASFCGMLSISHTRYHGAAAINMIENAVVGIDLVHQQDVSSDLQDRVCNSSELEWIHTKELSFCEIWALKEAGLKAWQVGMSIPIWNVNLRKFDRNSYQIFSHNMPTLVGSVFSPVGRVYLGLAWSTVPLPNLDNHLIVRGKHLGC